MKIITGKTATAHVNSEDDRGLYAGIFGSGSYILNTGTKFQTSIESSTTIRINSGDLVHQGCHARIPYDEYDEVTIDAGTTGYKRIDLIVARYERNAGLESMSLVAIKGQPAVSDPVAPDYNRGNIFERASISDCPLYKVMLDGVNIESVERIITVLDNRLEDIQDIYEINALARDAMIKGTDAYDYADRAYVLANGANNLAIEAGGIANSAQDTANTAEEMADEALAKVTNVIAQMNNAAEMTPTINDYTSQLINATDWSQARTLTVSALQAVSEALSRLENNEREIENE